MDQRLFSSGQRSLTHNAILYSLYSLLRIFIFNVKVSKSRAAHRHVSETGVSPQRLQSGSKYACRAIPAAVTGEGCGSTHGPHADSQ